jgi:hypothetical protein
MHSMRGSHYTATLEADIDAGTGARPTIIGVEMLKGFEKSDLHCLSTGLADDMSSIMQNSVRRGEDSELSNLGYIKTYAGLVSRR